MITQLNEVRSVKTNDRVAAESGETVDRIFDLAINMEPEDGVIPRLRPRRRQHHRFLSVRYRKPA